MSIYCFCMFGLNRYLPVNNFSVTSGRISLGWTSIKQWKKCLAQGHNTSDSTGVEAQNSNPSISSLTLYQLTELSHWAPVNVNFVSANSTDPEVHFICVFTVCQSTCLRVSGPQRLRLDISCKLSTNHTHKMSSFIFAQTWIRAVARQHTLPLHNPYLGLSMRN